MGYKGPIAALVCAAIVLTGCNRILGGPTGTVEEFIERAEDGDVPGMTKLFSSGAVARKGAKQIEENNSGFSEMSLAALQAGGQPRMENVVEKITGDRATVTFAYKDRKRNDSVGLTFLLVKEGDAWKIDDVGGPELAENPNAYGAPPPAPAPPPPAPPPPPPAGESEGTKWPVSSGALETKAVELPKPAYPPAAKAANATGTVVVDVVVDETGTVTSATATTGHPLLRAAAVEAARKARFKPTLVAGKPVKVGGTLSYSFAP